MKNDPVAQRMVIVGSEPGEVDSVIAADISFQHKKAGGMLFTLEELLLDADTYVIKEDGTEGIILTTHGEPGKVGDFDPSEIIDGLKKIVNIEKAKYIYIASCDAATSPGGEVPSVIAAIGAAFPGINVCGAPGIAITDYRGISGDHQTVYKKNEPRGNPLEDVACFIEEVVTSLLYPDVKEPLELDDLKGVEAKGNWLLSDPKFNFFYDTLIKALLGQSDVGILESLNAKSGEMLNVYEIQLKECDTQLQTINGMTKELQEKYQEDKSMLMDDIAYLKKQIEIIIIAQKLMNERIPVITNALRKEAPLRDKAGTQISYDTLFK